MTVQTARKRFWNDWHEFKTNPNGNEVKTYINRMKTELGYNAPTQQQVEKQLLQEVSLFRHNN